MNTSTLATYYRLTKPGIIRGNVMVAVAAYLLGSAGSIDWLGLSALVVGLSLVIASACVFNNVIDRDIDAIMERTKSRAVPSGRVSTASALLFASTLLLAGTLLLAFLSNWPALAVALVGHVAYVVLYGWGKRRTVHGTLIGTISGSTPPVIGYVAATGSLDLNALLLFLILVAWQMPHFYAIAIFRKDDYASAGIPVLSVVKGLVATRRQMIAYTALFVLLCALLGTIGSLSTLGLFILVLAGSYWLYSVAQPSGDEAQAVAWARRQFGTSLSVLLIFSLTLSLDSFWH